uniref:glutamate--tRNA ligase n=1 Tax=Parascaris univalens TaxID=6257 RepID=A0A915AYC0_PARUN
SLSGAFASAMADKEKVVRLKLSRENPAYGSLLALGAAGFSVHDSVDLIDSDHNEFTIDGITYTNDASIARFIAKACGRGAELFGSDIVEQIQVDEWVTSVEELLEHGGSKDALMASVVEKLGVSHFLALNRLTLADFVVWTLVANDLKLRKEGPLMEFFENILHDKRFAEAHAVAGKFSIASSSTTKQEKETNVKKPAQGKEKTRDEGKFVELPGAEKGKVVVRFPPEASGYLHIGHAKAALLNQYYQETFEGQLIMRFDDTNPAKENAHFEQVIKEDLKMLEVVPDRWTHTSDHFDTLLEYCERLLKEGKAFVDDTDSDTMRKEREERQDSKNRNSPVATNLALWDEMKRGTEKGQQCCVRIKIDMKSNNGALRDPTIYRCKNEPHVRTGDKYRVYPTYDFACPIVDSLEGVTHALRTTEYTDRDEQYYFICDALGLRKPYIWSYARLNMTNTVMSKRKLTWFVDEHHVDGWSDPRLPTVRGMMRHGLTVEGLKQFIVAQGGSRSVVTMEWDKIWSFNKKVIDPIAPRYTALSTNEQLVPVTVQDQKDVQSKDVSLHPKRDDIGEKTIWYSGKVFVEKVDAQEMKHGDTVTFINWGNMKIADVKRDAKGAVTRITATLDLDNKDYKKTLKVTWIAEVPLGARIPVISVEYDHIITKPIIGKDEDWKQFINYDSVHFKQMSGEPALKSVRKGDIIQIQRKGFYICDCEYSEKSDFSGHEMPLILIAIPDGSRHTSPPAGTVKGSSTKKAVVDSGENSDALQLEIEKQGILVRQLKAVDPKSAESKSAIAKLLELKKKYKEVTGGDYKPKPAADVTVSEPQLTGAVAARSQAAHADLGSSRTASTGSAQFAHAEDLREQIGKQGDKVRLLKATSPKGEETKAAIAELLRLKAAFKDITGYDYKPKSATSAAQVTTSEPQLTAVLPTQSETTISYAESSEVTSASSKLTYMEDLFVQIKEQGEKVRSLKRGNPKGEETKAAIAKLLQLKATFKNITGSEYKPKLTTSAVQVTASEPQLTAVLPTQSETITSNEASSQVTPASSDSTYVEDLFVQIEKQGNKVRSLKASNTKAEETKAAIAELLQLKAAYKNVTGSEYKPKQTTSTTQQTASKGPSIEALAVHSETAISNGLSSEATASPTSSAAKDGSRSVESETTQTASENDKEAATKLFR